MGLLEQGKALQRKRLPTSWAGTTWILAPCTGPVALAALEQNISLENEKDLAELAASP